MAGKAGLCDPFRVRADSAFARWRTSLGASGPRLTTTAEDSHSAHALRHHLLPYAVHNAVAPSNRESIWTVSNTPRRVLRLFLPPELMLGPLVVNALDLMFAS